MFAASADNYRSMRLSTRILISAVLLCGACLCQRANSQTNPAKKDVDATISGKVTFKGKPVPGIVVGVRLNKGELPPTFKTTTDQAGIYRMTGLSEGSYQVAPIAPAFVIADVREHWGRSVVVTASENIEGVNFDLIRGGVITGRVVDAHGHPIVEERISVVTADYPRDGRSTISGGFQTDDRGIYRIFGVRPGSYKVSIGEEGSGIYSRAGRPLGVPRTYHPDTADPAKAAVIKLEEGSEATKIDITLGDPPEGFAVSGRIVESETGKPVPNLTIVLEKITIIDANSRSGYSAGTDARSNVEGAFRLDKLPPGKYSINIHVPSESDLRAEPVAFDVLDQDVTGLVIKTSRGASLSGTVVLENRERIGGEPGGPTWLSVFLRHEDHRGGTYTSSESAQIKPDGSFRIGGLVAGTVSFSVGSFSSMGNAKPMTISRVERGGILQPNGVEVRHGEHVSDIRIVAAYSSGSIRGMVKVQNGTLPPTAHLVISLTKVGDANWTTGGGTATDSRGHFLIEGLAAGTYEVRVTAYVPEWRSRQPTSKQLVNVNDGSATDVMLTIDLTQGPKQ